MPHNPGRVVVFVFWLSPGGGNEEEPVRLLVVLSPSSPVAEPLSKLSSLAVGESPLPASG